MMGDLEAGLPEERSYLISSYKNVQDSGLVLDNSKRLAGETEEAAARVLSELRSQRETINRTRHSLRNIGEIHDEAQGLITNINQRDFVNKLVLYAIIVVETFAIISVLISKITRK